MTFYFEFLFLFLWLLVEGLKTVVFIHSEYCKILNEKNTPIFNIANQIPILFVVKSLKFFLPKVNKSYIPQ